MNAQEYAQEYQKILDQLLRIEQRRLYDFDLRESRALKDGLADARDGLRAAIKALQEVA